MRNTTSSVRQDTIGSSPHSDSVPDRMLVVARSAFGADSLGPWLRVAVAMISFCTLSPAQDAQKIELVKKGDRVLLYEYAAGLYFATASLDFENMDKLLRTKDGIEALQGNRVQAAMFAFMCFIDRTRVHVNESSDMFNSAVANGTRRLMSRTSWEDVAKYARSPEGKALIKTYFANYPEASVEQDLIAFKKWCDERTKNRRR